MCFYQGEVSIQKPKLVALEACKSLADVASDPSKVRLVAVERQDLLVRHNPWAVPQKEGNHESLILPFNGNVIYLYRLLLGVPFAPFSRVLEYQILVHWQYLGFSKDEGGLLISSNQLKSCLPSMC